MADHANMTTDTHDESATAAAKRRRAVVRALITGVLCVILLIALLRSLELDDVKRAFAAADPGILILGLLAYVGSYVCRALRFRLLLYSTRPPLLDLIGVVSVHNLLNMVLPVRTGELSYVVLASRRYGVSLGEGAASLLLARLYDVLGIAVFFVTAVIAHRASLDGDPRDLALIGGGLVLASLLIILFLLPAIRGTHRALRRVLKALGVLDRPLVQRVMQKGDALLWHLQEIQARKTAAGVFLITEAQWLMTFLTCFAIVRAIDIPFAFDAAVLGSTGLSIALILPINTFANVGTFEAGWVAGYVLAGMSRSDATTSALVAHVFIMLFAVLLAALGRFFLLRAPLPLAADPDRSASS